MPINYDQFQAMQQAVSNLQAKGKWNDALSQEYDKAKRRIFEQQPELRVQSSLQSTFPDAQVGTFTPQESRQYRQFQSDRQEVEAGMDPNAAINRAFQGTGTDRGTLESLSRIDTGPAREIMQDFTNIPTTDLSPEGFGQAYGRALPETPVLRGAAAGVQRFGMGKASLMQRVFGDQQAATEMLETRDAAHQDLSMTDSAVAGAVDSVSTALSTALGGPAVMYGTFTADAMNEAVKKGQDAGLTGSELGKYVVGQGAIEAVVSGTFHRLGLGGMESAVARSAQQGITNAIRRAGYDTLAELPEEVIISLSSAVHDRLTGVDEEELTAERMLAITGETTFQTLITMGLASGLRQGTTRPDQETATGQIEGGMETISPDSYAATPEFRPNRMLLSRQQVLDREADQAEQDYREALAEFEQAEADPATGPTIQVGRFGEAGTAEQQEAYHDQMVQRLQETTEQSQRLLPAPEADPRFVAGEEGVRDRGPMAEQTNWRSPERRETEGPLAEGRQRVEELTGEGKLEAAEAEIERLKTEARTEPLTGLNNKRAWDEGIQDLKDMAESKGTAQSFLFFDAANLKAANDLLGHEGADDVIRDIANKLKNAAGEKAKVFRQGGDEFGVILPKGMGRRKAKKLMDEIEASIGRSEITPGLSMFLAGGVGTIKPGQSPKEALLAADHESETRKRALKTKLGEPLERSQAEAIIAERLAQQPTAEGRPVLPDFPETQSPQMLEKTTRLKSLKKHAVGKRKAAQERAEYKPEEPGSFNTEAAEFIIEAIVPGIDHVRDQSRIHQFVSKAAVPIGTVIRRWAPRLYGRLKQHQSHYRRDRHDVDAQVRKLEDLLKTEFKKEERQKVLYHLQSENAEAAQEIIQSSKNADKINEQLTIITDQMASWRDQAIESGMKIGYVESYFPRQVRPEKYEQWTEVLTGEERNELNRIIDTERARVGRPLTTDEKVELANKWVAGYRRDDAGKTSPRSLSQRSVKNMTFEQWKEFYETDLRPAYAYFDRIIYNTHKAHLFGKGSADEPLTETIGRMFVEGKYGINKLSAYQQNRLKSAILSLYTGGEQSPAEAWRVLRDLGYTGTLLDPTSAAIQFGDFALIAARDGTLPMLGSISPAIREKVLTAEKMGLDHLSEEYGSHGKLSKALRKGFKAVGFHKVDASALTANMVSAVRSAKRMAKMKPDAPKAKEWRETWAPVFGEQFPELVRDLTNGVNSDLVQDYAYIVSSETRPIDMLDMPEYYAAKPNGRILWQLKGFALRQFDFVRQRGYRTIARGIRRRDPKLAAKGVRELVRTMVILSAAGASFDWIRDWLLGRNPSFSDSMVDGLLYTHLGSVYLLGIAGEKGPGTAITEFISPPVPDMMDTMWRDATNGSYKSLKYLPFGKTVYSFTPEGKAANAKYARRDTLDKAKQAMKDGDTDAVRTYLAAYNDSIKDVTDAKKLTMMSVRRAVNRSQ